MKVNNKVILYNFVYFNENKMKNTVKIWNIVWTHYTWPSKKEKENIIKEYDFHELIEEDIIEISTQEKIDVYDNYMFLVLNFPKYNNSVKKYYLNEFNIVMWKDFIITFSKHQTNHIEQMRKEYEKEIEEKDNDEEYKISPFYVLYKIIDAMYDKTLKMLKKSTQDITNMEEDLFRNRIWHKKLLENLTVKKRNIVFLKHTFLPQDEILVELQKIIPNFFKEELDVYFEDLEYKLDKIRNNIEVSFENIESLSDTYNTLMAIKNNSIITILTIFSAITWVLTFTTWIYWMNIILPFQNNKGFFSIFITLTFVLIWTLIFFFKKKKWI